MKIVAKGEAEIPNGFFAHDWRENKQHRILSYVLQVVLESQFVIEENPEAFYFVNLRNFSKVLYREVNVNPGKFSIEKGDKFGFVFRKECFIRDWP